MTNLRKQPLSNYLVLMMAIACGLCTGSNYYNQPLLSSIAHDFDVTMTVAAYSSVIAQTMFTIGLVLLVPLGDYFETKKTITGFMAIAALGQLICYLSWDIQVFFIGTAISSLFVVAAQILIPFSTILALPQQSAKVVGTLMSGLMMGILLARTAAGFISSIGEWHYVYLISGVLLLIFAMILQLKLPSHFPKKIQYFSIFHSMYVLIKTKPLLRQRSILGFLCFGTVSTVFTTMALLLSEQPYEYSDFQIGLVGLVGIAGIIIGPSIGKFFQKGKEQQLTHYSLILLILSWCVLYFAQVNLLIYVIGLIMIYIALTVLHITNQNVVYGIDPNSKSRLNAIYMGLYFSGAAIGSVIAIYLWNHFGWVGCCSYGMICAIACYVINKIAENK
ncbi:MFS transporter [Acinetobacter sp. LoGeW2-3]|uniref:MFS transporter n=1 Tax=Acinetobacter sp. LoGeW2-3 TaxID=1808001 RepID=UPI000C059171|nr:MFS transporter [Acinetobacter sp. LoGeW2-3]ATO20161.1 MFS transporter [Acinetobacter sp. LoGeW2-3]